MAVRISRGLFDRLLADARDVAAGAPSLLERCGLLFGADQHITHFAPVANIHADPSRHFELDPAALIAASRAARSGGPAVVGHYHSHPIGDSPEPSRNDAAAADADGRLWLIVTPTDAALWRAVPGGRHHGVFAPVIIVFD